MRSVRTTLKLAPKTQDEEFDRRRKSLKDLKDALDSYKNSMEKTKTYVRRAVESLSKIKTVFEQMTNSPDIPGGTRDLVLQYSATTDQITGDLFAQYSQSMDGEVIPAAMEMRKLYDDCMQQESNRNKLRKEFDVYRNEVAKKEAEYAKKNKDLSQSKSYGTDVVKRNDYQNRFEEADLKFKDTHDYLVSCTARCTNRCMLTFFQCTSAFTTGVGDAFRSLFETARMIEQEQPQTMVAQ